MIWRGALTWAYKNREILRSPEAYAAHVHKWGAEPQTAYFFRSSAEAGAYPEGPDGGWRYDFQRLPVHDKLLRFTSKKHLQANSFTDDFFDKGSTFTRALRIMDWLTEHTWYNGQSFWSCLRFWGTPGETPRLLRYACDAPFTHSINCGQVSFLLADCLLAAGICAMPVALCNYTYRADETPVNPCPNHCIVHVWLPEEHRWIMLDPSFGSYITDGAGRALNLIEIQARHRAGEELRVAQYNFNGTQDCQAEYLAGFVLGCLLEIAVYNGSGSHRLKGLRGRLLPEDVPPKDDKMRALTVTEFLAEPKT